MQSFFFAKVKIFRFWPKTMDYSRGFEAIFVFLLLLTVHIIHIIMKVPSISLVA